MPSYKLRSSEYQKIDLWAYPLLIMSSIIFLFILSTVTSPLYAGYGGDSAVFIMFGRMFNSGKIPYIDFFDHKGPMVIFIQAFAQKIYPPDSRLSTFILQLINISIIQVFFYKTLRQLLTPINSISLCFFVLVFLRYTIESGNLTEEYSLLFISITFYFTVKVLLNGLESLNKTQCFIIGICSAMLFWIRLNNTGVVFACILFICLLFIKSKQWKTFFTDIVVFLIGFAVITIPLLIYFIKNDALIDMLNSAFVHNLKYVEASHSEDHFQTIKTTLLHILKAWMPFIILLIGSIIYYLQTHKGSILIFSVLLFFFGYISTHIGNAYYHYMMLNIPALMLGSMYILKGVTIKSVTISILSLSILCLIAALVNVSYKNKPFHYKNQFIDDSKEIASKIPVDEQNSVYAYHTVNAFLPSAGLQPYYKYFMMQEWTGITNKHIITEINDMMRQNPPKWIVSEFRSQSTNTEFWKIIDQKYTRYFYNNNFELYKLNN